MPQPGITFDHVWKKFRRGERHDSLRDLIPAATRRLLGRHTPDGELAGQEFWAVKDVSFDVRPGEALGIIGPNGAGKSTTLKLLTRILKPTRGHCEVRGRAGALIEVAAGFHPDLTGRENVYLQGAIMGMRRSEIRQRFEQIVEFAGVGEFIDTPVKRYSSGMNARLGFGIAAHLDPDVMIIDEVLSVGDSGFQDKCVRHMRGMIGRGIPVVFVSHNLPAVLELCTRVLVVSRGTVVFDGDPAEGVQHYRTATSIQRGGDGVWSTPDTPIVIAKVELLSEGAPTLGVFRPGADFTVRIQYEARRPIESPNFQVEIHRADGLQCFMTNTFQQQKLGRLEGEGTVDLRIPNLALLPGCYTVSAGIYRDIGRGPYDLHSQAYPFSIESSTRDKGVVALEARWQHRTAPEPAALGRR